MIKVAFVIDAIYSPTGGTERQLILLIKHLDKTQFSPTLCVLRTSEWLEKEFDLCPLLLIGIGSLKGPVGISKILGFSRFLRQERFDIVQTFFFEGNLVGTIASKLAGIKNIVSTRRNQQSCAKHSHKIILKLLNPLASHFITNSFSTRELVSSTEGISVEKNSVIYNALDLQPFKNLSPNTKKLCRLKLGIKKNTLVIGIVANLRAIKGLDVFLMAVQKVKHHYPDSKYLIIGDGSVGIVKHQLHSLTQELDLVDCVNFMGKRLDVPELLTVFDIAVLTSKSEGFSNSIVEYIASGLPVVTTDVGGAREAVTDGVNGFIVPVDDFEAVAKAIVNIARGCLVKSNLLDKQQEAFEKYSLMQYIASHEKIYFELMG